MSASNPAVAELLTVRLDDITIPDGNHRQDLGDLESLAESIRRIGLVQPPTVRRNVTGDYQLVAGQRRVTAARMAGLSEIEVVVRDYSDGSSLHAAQATENIARKALSDVEEAVAYQELLDLGITSDDIASIVGTTTKRIGEYVSVLNLPKKVRRELSSGSINFDEALMLTQLADTPERLNAALRNAHNGWNLASAVQHELHEREVQRKIAASQEELEKRGVPIVEQPRETFSRRAKVQRLGNGWGCIPITPAKHAKEPCHAACVDSYGGDIIYLCTDVQRHAGVVPGIEAPEDRKAARAAKRAERQTEKLAVEARRTLLAKRLQSRTDTREATDLLKRVWILEADDGVAAIACDLLGIADVETGYRGHAATLVNRVDRHPEELSRVSLALALARGEQYAVRQYVSLDERLVFAQHLRYLVQLGYAPTEAERARAHTADEPFDGDGAAADASVDDAVAAE